MRGVDGPLCGLPSGTEGPDTARVRYLTFLGLMTGVLFTGVIVAQWIAVMMLPRRWVPHDAADAPARSRRAARGGTRVRCTARLARTGRCVGLRAARRDPASGHRVGVRAQVARLWRVAGVGHGERKWEAISFATGWLALVIALVSPLHPWGNALFSIHMTQHELLMLMAAPLLVLGKPVVASLKASRRPGCECFCAGRSPPGCGRVGSS